MTDVPSTDPPTAAFWRDRSVGDLVIRTSDNIDFHLHRDVLARVSPFFATMFSLPQPATGSPTADSKPLLEVTEDSKTCAIFIPLCYTPHQPIPRDLALIRALLDAARKYQIAQVSNAVSAALLLQPSLLSAHALGLYALACAYALPDLARAAARHSLRSSVYFSYVQELELISFRDFHRLSEYRRQCSVAARTVTSWSGWLAPANMAPRAYLQVTCATKGCKKVLRGGAYVRQAWANYVDKLDRILELTPDGAQACAPVLLDPVYKSAEECVVCLKSLHTHVSAFSNMLQQQIEKAVDEVCVYPPYSSLSLGLVAGC